MSSLFKQRPHRGGPHFERLSTLCFDLEGIALEFTLPASDLVMKEPPRPLNLPFNSPGWFEAHSKRRNLNDYVHLSTEIWNYFPARLTRLINLMVMGSNEQMGQLSMGVHLNKLQGGKKLDLSNPTSLGDYIKWEYDDYYESPVTGEYGRGMNCEVRSKYGQLLEKKGEWYRPQYETALRSYLEPTPNHYDLLDFGGGQWTYFRLERGWTRTTHYYSIPVSECYFLRIYFGLLFEVSDKNRPVLEPDMMKAVEWIRQHIKITFPGKPAGSVALPE